MNSNPAPARRRSFWFMTGSILWVLCGVLIIYGWYDWHRRDQAFKAKEAASATNAGRNTKQVILVPQADGNLAPQEVTREELENPWDADGIEDFSFTDTNGKTVTKQDLLGKPFIIAFVFTKCLGPCPNVTKQMREIQDRLKDYDFNLVTLTVDPDRDTNEILQRYGQDNGANFDRWHFMTGDQAAIYGLIHRSFKMPVQELTGDDRKPGFEIIHSTNILLVNAAGRVIGKYDARKDEEMSRLRKDLKAIANPSSATPRASEGQP